MDKFVKETFLGQNLPVKILFSSMWATFLIPDTTKYTLEKVD